MDSVQRDRRKWTKADTTVQLKWGDLLLGAQRVPTVLWADPVGTFESYVMGSLHLFETIRHMLLTRMDVGLVG